MKPSERIIKEMSIMHSYNIYDKQGRQSNIYLTSRKNYFDANIKGEYNDYYTPIVVTMQTHAGSPSMRLADYLKVEWSVVKDKMIELGAIHRNGEYVFKEKKQADEFLEWARASELLLTLVGE